VFNALWVDAEPVPAEDVVAAARGWLALTDTAPLGDSLGSGLDFMTPGTDGKGGLLYYAVSLENGGVLVMAPDDAIEPVIAFASEAGDLSDPAPCNHLRLMLDADLAGRLADVKAGKVQNAAAKAAKWALLIAAAKDPAGMKAGLGSVSEVRVSPLIYTKWNQSYVYQGSSKLACYNYYTPPYTAGAYQNYYCGCTATALAQLIGYHKHPKKGVGTIACTIHVDGAGPYSRNTRGGNGFGGPYDWANMPADPAGLAKAGRLNTTQRMAIGALCHDAAVASTMKFSSSGSSAPLCWSKGTHPLQTVFKYANVDSPWVAVNTTFAKKDINSALNPSLDANMPCAMAINNNDGGAHAVVVDGYGYAFNALYHHVNMGWGGVDTAWYNLPTVKDVQDSPYYRVTGMLFNLNPTQSGISVISGRTLNLAGNPLAGVKVVAKHTGGVYPNKATVSNARGIYALLLPTGQYKVSATMSGRGFNPQSRTVSVGYSTVRNSWFNNFKAVTRIIRLSTTKLAFGTVASGSSKTLKFSIFNDGNAALSVSDIVCPAGFTTVPSAPFSVPPNGGKVVVSVTFAPAAAGFVTGDLTVKCDKSSGVNKLTVKGTGGPAISEVVSIPAGSFSMGDNFNEGGGLPVHTVTLSAFFMDRYEVTKALWDEVLNWSWTVGTGYSYNKVSTGEAANHPVQTEEWYDILKWCNARSQKEGRTPVYYTDAGLIQIYKTGSSEPYVNWAANGYRLPTEAEWEKAARGGVSARRFPWGDIDTIQHARANYYSSSSYTYDTSPTRGYHPSYSTEGEYGETFPHTSPVGSFAPNGYGLYDMAGNVDEWCWDWYDGAYYSSSPGSDPRGPDAPDWRNGRVKRGGNCATSALECRSANRSFRSPGDNDWQTYQIGFRAVRNSP
jgi:formylglycine-generating enzyme required for sulfatase activity